MFCLAKSATDGFAVFCTSFPICSHADMCSLFNCFSLCSVFCFRILFNWFAKYSLSVYEQFPQILKNSVHPYSNKDKLLLCLRYCVSQLNRRLAYSMKYISYSCKLPFSKAFFFVFSLRVWLVFSTRSISRSMPCQRYAFCLGACISLALQNVQAHPLIEWSSIYICPHAYWKKIA